MPSPSQGPHAWSAQVSERDGGLRLDQFLARELPSLSRTRLQELVRSGCVRVQSQVIERPSHRLAPRDRVEVVIAPPPVREEASLEGRELEVVFADEDLAVIDKPAGLLAHPGPNTHGPSVSALAERRFGELPRLQGEDRPGIVHRLDAGTSGLMVLGLRKDSFDVLQNQFRARSVLKIYRAIVHGEPRFDSGWIEARIGRSAAHPDRMSVVESSEGRDASTYYGVIERFRGFALLDCQPKTGRTHQIRVHLAHAEHPIVGDPIYKRRGPHKIALAPEAPRLARQGLHAAVLGFEHPRTGERLRFESPMPPDMQALLDWLRAHHAPSP
jgi:23S rRNA pseudouridine1911/1915/1917 synthase